MHCISDLTSACPGSFSTHILDVLYQKYYYHYGIATTLPVLQGGNCTAGRRAAVRTPLLYVCVAGGQHAKLFEPFVSSHIERLSLL